MIYQKLNETDIASLRAVVLTPSGERLLDYVESKNEPAYQPEENHDSNRIAFRAAYSQGYNDALKCLIDILTPNENTQQSMMNAGYQSPNN